ncbi:hypothetical protein ACT7C2_13685 [Bacillus pacificus]
MLAKINKKARSSIFDMAGDIPEETSVVNRSEIDESEDKEKKYTFMKTSN